MANEMIETANADESVNRPHSAAAAPLPVSKWGRLVSDEEAEADFAAFTRALGVEPEDW